MAAEDRFANVFTASVTMTGANALTFAELQFGITLRDRIAIAIDEILFYPSSAVIAEMTATGDLVDLGLCTSDQITNIADLADRRILYNSRFIRLDYGTAAAAQMIYLPIKVEFNPPMISLPNRLFFGMDTVGLASAGGCTMRMHYRTVNITQDQQLIEVLEAFQLST